MDRRFRNYSQEEDEIIWYYMRGVKSNHILERCRFVQERYLPERDAEGIRKRWYKLVSYEYQPSEFKNLADLLSPEQKKRIRTRLPSFKNIKVKL